MEELADHKEVTAAAFASLEATLTRLERANVTGRGGRSATPPRLKQQPHQQQILSGRGGPTGAGSSSARSSRASEAGSGDDVIAAAFTAGGGGVGSASGVLLSRELVQTRLAVADLQRKLKVSARCVKAAAGLYTRLCSFQRDVRSADMPSD